MDKKMLAFGIIVVFMFLLSTWINQIENKETPDLPTLNESKTNETLEENPIVCTAEWAPVCGVDGKTYGNECSAGDVEIAYEGECNESHTCTAEEKENEICTTEYVPVCSNDGNTFSNGCVACSTGVESWTSGICNNI